MTCAITYAVAMGVLCALAIAAAITSGADRIARAIEKRSEETPE